jgi:anti-anti-sigma regulatory factor
VQATCDIQFRTTSNNKGLVIDVAGFFNVSCLNQFRCAFESQPRHFPRYAVNMQQCRGIDSAGLGMLLLLRDFSKLDPDNLLITHCPPEVHQVLRYANFDQLFTILN